MRDTKVVWVLGAGFSKPLGGPTLYDLFTERFEIGLLGTLQAFDVRGRSAPSEPFHEVFARLRWLYDHEPQERKVSNPFAGQGGPWPDAEQFLEYLDLAAGGGKAAQATLQNIMASRRTGYDARLSPYERIASDARRYLACACHHFIGPPEMIDRLERWEPYHDWARGLQPGDHVLTFNYDRVVESSANGRVRLFWPESGAHNYIEKGNLLVKLHGSVDWVIRDGKLAMIEDPWTNLGPSAPPFAIGMPGPNKAASMTTLFGPHWEFAARLLARATHVIFVGYRMPESDARARSWMLQMLRNNTNKPQIHIVLGLQSDKDVSRLTKLFEWGLPDAGPIVPEPLWAQDFLAVFDRDKLKLE